MGSNNLTVQIEHIQDSDLDFSAAVTPSPRSPGSLKIVKSHSTEIVETAKQKVVKRTESFSNLFKTTESRENSHSKREMSKIRRTEKREKWKYYQKQQASGIEYVTRYTVLVLLSSMSSLAMVAVLMSHLDAFDGDMVGAFGFHAVFVLDVIINCVVIYFYFIFSKRCYHSICCLCHSCIQSCCVKLCI